VLVDPAPSEGRGGLILSVQHYRFIIVIIIAVAIIAVRCSTRLLLVVATRQPTSATIHSLHTYLYDYRNQFLRCVIATRASELCRLSVGSP
jgi:hypothetical protein